MRKPDEPETRDLVERLNAGKLSRREFVTRASALGLSVGAIGSLLAACGGEAEEAATTAAETGAAATTGPETGAATGAVSGEDPAAIAVEAAKQYAGYTVKLTYEGGLQALDPKNFSGPTWEELTGIKSQVIELPYPELYSKPIAEHIAKSGAFDILDVPPPNLPSFVEGGVVMPIDDFIEQFGFVEAQEDVQPLYRPLGTYKGETYGIFDDGDMFALYYRRDIFEDPELAGQHMDELGRELLPPSTWDEYLETATFLTDKLKSEGIYGAGAFRKQGSPGNQFAFFQQLRAYGGTFFDPETMDPLINSDAGVKTFENMLAVNKVSIPGVEELDAVGQWTAWLQGKLATIFSWPPTGRISENYAQRDPSFSFIPKSQIVGKVGYAVMPDKNGEHAAGFVKCISADSQNPEAAYLMLQWLTSPSISLQRVMLPYALRDPYRISHYTSPEYQGLWPSAKDYLFNLNAAANTAVIDLIMPGAADYSFAVDRAAGAVWGGKDPKQALDDAAAEWNRITDDLGRDTQKDAYAAFLTLPGATRDDTVEALGQAVSL